MSSVRQTSFAPSPPARPHVLTFRVSASELRYLDDLGERHGLTRSEIVRAIFAGRIDTSDKPEPSGKTTDIRV